MTFSKVMRHRTWKNIFISIFTEPAIDWLLVDLFDLNKIFFFNFFLLSLLRHRIYGIAGVVTFDFIHIYSLSLSFTHLFLTRCLNVKKNCFYEGWGILSTCQSFATISFSLVDLIANFLIKHSFMTSLKGSFCR